MGITRPGKLAAVIGPAGTAISVAEAFADIAEIRNRVKPPEALTVKDLIEERPPGDCVSLSARRTETPAGQPQRRRGYFLLLHILRILLQLLRDGREWRPFLRVSLEQRSRDLRPQRPVMHRELVRLAG
jgi:hypothetical protein